MATKKVPFSKSGIADLPKDKPVLYRIETANGKLNYTGIAKRGRAQERLSEHLGEIPGATVRIEQFGKIEEARAKEANVIKRNQPKYNEQGK
jgi:hypothetical protein